MSSSAFLIVLSAPSGAGKTTLCSRLLKDLGDRVQLSVSTTTRAPRGQEVEGKHYFFVSPEEFQKRIAKSEFAEWALVHGSYYGTSKRTLEEALQNGKSVLLDIDVQGAASLKATFGSRCLTVFISPPSMELLEKRLRDRATDSEEVIQRRMKNAQDEMSRASEFEHQIVNDDLDRAYAELLTLLQRRFEST